MRGPRPVLLVSAAIPLVCLCGMSCTRPDPEPPPRLSVAVNVWAIGWLVTQIGGELTAEPQQLEAEAHEPPTEADLALLERVDAVVYVGNMSIEAQEVIDRRWPPDSDDRDRFTDVSRLNPDADDDFELLVAPPELDDEEALPGGLDPHVWLDPLYMKDEVAKSIQHALTVAVDADPELGPSRVQYADELFGRARDTMTRLDELHRAIEGTLQTCNGLTVVAEHPAYQYLTTRYGLEQLPVTPFVGGVLDPSAEERQRQALEDEWRDTSTRTIFLEDSYGYGPDRTQDPERRYINDLANDLVAFLLYLSSLEEPPSAAGDVGPPEGYIEAMHRNADTIRSGLGC